MRCPLCGCRDSRVVDSRPAGDGSRIRRRRECPACRHRFTTRESLDEAPVMVIKKDGRREEFNPGKVLDGFVKACEKRPVPLERLEALVDDMLARFRARKTRETTVAEIGEQALAALLEIDKIAYVRFASVYRNFDEPEDFLREVEHLFEDDGRRGTVRVDVKRVRDTELPLPAYARPGDAGVDLMNAGGEVTIAPGGRVLVPTGIAVAVPLGYELQIRPRSGLALEHGLTVVNSPGTVDSGYRGEIGVILMNADPVRAVTIAHGDRIAQAVLSKCETIDWAEVDELPSSDRSDGGFGSTGRGRD